MGISLGDAILHLKTDKSELESGLQGATGGITSWLGGIQAKLLGVFSAVAITAAAKRAVEDYQALAAQVRDLSSITGQTAEQSSRLIAVMDDFEVTSGDLTTAMRTMRERGINPTVDSLADMSDAYLACAPGLERQNYLADNFGARVGPRFALVMQQGGEAIRARSQAVERGLILDDRQLAASEALRVATEDLSDSAKSLAFVVSSWVVPAMANYTEELVRNVTASREEVDASEEMERRFGVVTTTARELEAAGRDAAGGVTEVARALLSIPPVTPAHIAFSTNLRAFLADNPELMYLLAASGGRGGGVMFTATEQAQGMWAAAGGNVGAGGGLTAAMIRANNRMVAGGNAPWTEAQFIAAGYTPGQHGLDFDVEGPSGTDQVPVNLALTRREHVRVTPEGEGGSGQVVNNYWNITVRNDEDLQALQNRIIQVFRGV